MLHRRCSSYLGECARDAGDPSGAERWLRAAVSLAEAQSADNTTAYLVRAFESATNASAYTELASLLASSGRITEAFHVIEAGRGQALRRALAERAVPGRTLAAWEQFDLAQEQKRRAALCRICDASARARRSIDPRRMYWFRACARRRWRWSWTPVNPPCERNFRSAGSLATRVGTSAGEVSTGLAALGPGTVLVDTPLAVPIRRSSS